MIPQIVNGLSASPDEFYLLLAIVLALLPLQTYLGLALHKRSTAGTSLWNCFFAISGAKFYKIKEAEPDAFQATLKAYQRTYIIAMLPVLALIFAIYVWLKAW